jgi:prepilin-type N-terminal cleavage/methylation domain-containing protein
MKRISKRGFTLVEVLVVVIVVSILTSVGVIMTSEASSETKCLEIQSILPQIIRSQASHYLKNNRYFTAGHQELEDYGVDVRDAIYFTYSTIPREGSSFSIRFEATAWAPGGWVLYLHEGDDRWSCDGSLIKRSWLPD